MSFLLSDRGLEDLGIVAESRWGLKTRQLLEISRIQNGRRDLERRGPRNETKLIPFCWTEEHDLFN